jgi:D-alanine-D-alanine ligase
MRVLVLHTLAPERCENGRSTGEFELDAAAANVASALDGAAVVGVRGEASGIIAMVDRHRPDVIFNLCEAPLGQPRLEAHAAALLEWIGVPFTGSGSETLTLCRRKDLVNAVLAGSGVAVPRTGVYPCIVKPADEDGSAGINAESVCEDDLEVARARARWRGATVVQEFLPGREFAISVWGHSEPEHISIGETRFRNALRLITYSAKWDVESADFADTPLDYDTEIEDGLRTALTNEVRKTWQVVGARGYLRVDLRCDAAGRPYVLDVNPNPELGPGVGICRAVQEAGWSWKNLVHRQVEWALAH